MNTIRPMALQQNGAFTPASRTQLDVEHVTILAHDLRNYLTPAYTHLTALYGRAQREQRELDMQAAKRARQALDHALLLITNIVEATRDERGLFELNEQLLDLTAIAQQAAEVFDTAETPILFQSSEHMLLSGDCEKLRQVLHNLLANAVTHSPRGAPVTVDARIQQRDNSQWGVLTVHNGGPAIPRHLMPYIFQRFAAGPTSRGLGLGLYLARSIIEAHGGTLTAHSHNDTGTSFVIALPLTAGKECY